MAYDAEWSTGPLPIDDASESHKKALGKSLQARSAQKLGIEMIVKGPVMDYRSDCEA